MKIDHTCPHCGHNNTDATCPSDLGAEPSPGDWLFCMTCGEWAIFDVIRPRKPTPAECLEIASDTSARNLDRVWHDKMGRL